MARAKKKTSDAAAGDVDVVDVDLNVVAMPPATQMPLRKLLPAEWNANRVPAKQMLKIRRSIETFGFIENLVARPHPEQPGKFEVLSGNHRLAILVELGQQSAPVVVVEVDDAHARLLAQTINRTRGRDDPRAYKKLLSEILSSMSAQDAAGYLPVEPQRLEEVLGNIDAPPDNVPEIWGVIVDCANEAQQLELLERFTEEGLTCRALLGGT